MPLDSYRDSPPEKSGGGKRAAVSVTYKKGFPPRSLAYSPLSSIFAPHLSSLRGCAGHLDRPVQPFQLSHKQQVTIQEVSFEREIENFPLKGDSCYSEEEGCFVFFENFIQNFQKNKTT